MKLNEEMNKTIADILLMGYKVGDKVSAKDKTNIYAGLYIKELQQEVIALKERCAMLQRDLDIASESDMIPRNIHADILSHECYKIYREVERYKILLKIINECIDAMLKEPNISEQQVAVLRPLKEVQVTAQAALHKVKGECENEK